MIATTTEPKLRRFTREEYYRMADLGLFEDQHVELIGGEIIVMSPQNPQHATAIKRVEIRLELLFGANSFIRTQLPLNLGLNSNPEPDLAVVSGAFEDYSDRHPDSALLVVEVCDATLDYCRTRKASLYAAGGIKDYWLVNLPAAQVEVYRNPIKARGEAFGYRFGKEAVFKSGDSIAPLARPKSLIEIKKLLPRK